PGTLVVVSGAAAHHCRADTMKHHETASSHSPWYLLGAGNMGTLAAYYLHAADMPLTVLRRQGPPSLAKTLSFLDERLPRRLTLPVTLVGESPVRRLVVACKTPYTAAALRDLPLADDVLVLRLQNG